MHQAGLSNLASLISIFVKLGSCSSSLKSSKFNSIQKKRSRADAIIQMHPPTTPNFLKLVEGWFSLSFSSQLYEKYFHDFLNEFPIDFSIHFSDKFSDKFSNDFSNVYVLNILFLSKPTCLNIFSKIFKIFFSKIFKIFLDAIASLATWHECQSVTHTFAKKS